jgi:glyoxylase-like metal-dependent hydrolase (beta-lactamase superfamily II)
VNRCDFPGGSAETLWASIQKLKSKITKNTKIYVGHDYGLNGKREIQYETSLEHIVAQNVHLNDNVQSGLFFNFDFAIFISDLAQLN